MCKISMIKIYCYTNKLTNKPCYVGQTRKTLKERAGGSTGILYKSCRYFWDEIQKYNGFGNFKGEVLAEVEDPEYANLLEWFYTIEFKTYYPFGCNIMKGHKHSLDTKVYLSEKKKGKPFPQNTWSKGKIISEEQKRKMSEKLKGRTHIVSEETRQKISNSLKGRLHSDEYKQKMSEVCKGKNTWSKGKVVSEETRKKLSEKLKGHEGWNKGMVMNSETRRKMSESHKGLTAYNKGGIWFTNGVENKCCSECPEGFWRGLTRKCQ